MSVSREQSVWILERALNLLYEKRVECERESSVAVGIRKIEWKAKLTREILPEIARCESEYVRRLIEAADDARISTAEAEATVANLRQACRLEVTHAEDEMTLLQEIAQRLDDAGTPVEKLKSALPGLELAVYSRAQSAAASLAEAKRAVIRLLRASVQSDPNHPPNAFNPPSKLVGLPPRNALFTGREAELNELRQALESGRCVAITAAAGGIGKTQTAIEYAYRHAERYSAILWTRADSDIALSFGFAAFAAELGFPVKESHDDLIAAVKRWLAERADSLLILDGADKPHAAVDELAVSEAGHVILTSRSSDFYEREGIAPLRLDVLPPDAAVAFLKRRAGRPAAERPEEESAARELAGLLGFLPLALERIGAYAAGRGATFRECLEQCRLQGVGESAQKTNVWADAVAGTWRMNFSVVDGEFPASADVLRLCSFFAPSAIPLSLIEHGASDVSSTVASAMTKGVTASDLIEPLVRYALVRADERLAAFEAHRLTQAAAKADMDDATRRAWAARAAQALNAEFPRAVLDGWTACSRLLPHALAVAESVDVSGDVTEVTWLLNQAGGFLFERGRRTDAERLYARALQLRELTYGPDHLSVAASLNNLAAVYVKRGKYAEAEPLYVRGLAIREAKLGRRHTATAESMTKLADLHGAQGRYAESAAMWGEAASVLEKTCGEAHPTTLAAMESHCALLVRIGDVEKAYEVQRRLAALKARNLDE